MDINMNEQPTPETDSKARYPGVCDCYKHDDSGLYVDIYFAQRLERERDEARRVGAKWHLMAIAADRRLVKVLRERDLEQLKQ